MIPPIPPVEFGIPGLPPVFSAAGRLAKAFVPNAWADGLPEAGLASKAATGLSGLAGGAIGYLGSKGIQKALPGSSTWEHVLSGASQGAGAGAGIGLAADGIGAIPGALIGGVAGGIGGLLFGGKKKDKSADATDQLARAFQAANLDPSVEAKLSHYYSVLNTLGGDTKESRTQALGTVGQLIQQEVLNGMNSTTAQPMTPDQNAAIQLQTSNFLAPYLKQTLDTASEAARVTLSQLNNVPEQYRGVMAAGASQQLAATTRLANAYAAQAQLAPQAQAIQNQQQQQQALAAQLQQQAIAAQLSGTVGTGASNPYAQLPTG